MKMAAFYITKFEIDSLKPLNQKLLKRMG